MCEGEISNAKEPFKAFICKAIPGSIESITSIGDGFNKSRERYQGSDASSAVMVLGSMVLGNVIDPMPTPNGKSKGNPKASKEECCDKKENKAVTSSSEGNGPKIIGKTKVKCFDKNDKYKGKDEEYDRQLKNQQDALNTMDVDSYLASRKAFSGVVCKEDGSLGKDPNWNKEVDRPKRDQSKVDEAKAIYREDREKTLKKDKTLSSKDREGIIDKEMSTLAALHNPDMIAAGLDMFNLNDIKVAMGDRSVNSSIGSSWTSRIGDVDADACRAKKEGKGKDKMNVELERCNKKGKK